MVFGEGLAGVDDGDPNVPVVQGADIRGVYWYDHVAASQVFTRATPNTTIPDAIYAAWCSPTVELPALDLPCTGGDGYHATILCCAVDPGRGTHLFVRWFRALHCRRRSPICLAGYGRHR